MDPQQDVNTNRQLAVLRAYGLDDETGVAVLAAATHLSEEGGPDRWRIWTLVPEGPLATVDGLRDEMMIFNAELMATVRALLTEDLVHGWATQYASAFAYIARSVWQSEMAVDLLATANCYTDGLSICRTLVGRVNLAILFALNPWLFDDWYEHPAEDRYLDGRVREVLASNGLEFFGRIYGELSEAIHLHSTILNESGYMEPGLFPLLPAMRARLFIVAKLLVGACAAVGVALARQDSAGRRLPPRLEVVSRGLDQTISLLDANRLEHLAVTIAPDRHWMWTGKKKAVIGTRFDWGHLQDQLEKFHRDRGQRKTLRAPYEFNEKDAEGRREALAAASDAEPATIANAAGPSEHHEPPREQSTTRSRPGRRRSRGHAGDRP